MSDQLGPEDEIKRLRRAHNIVKAWVEIAWRRQTRIGHRLDALIDLLTQRGIVSGEDIDQRAKKAEGQEWLADSGPGDILQILLRAADRLDDAAAEHLAQLSPEEAELFLRRLDSERFLRRRDEEEKKKERGEPT
jgi:hypothetical protein